MVPPLSSDCLLSVTWRTQELEMKRWALKVHPLSHAHCFSALFSSFTLVTDSQHMAETAF